MEQINNKLGKFLSDIIKLIRKPVMSILPGQLSFFLLLSLIPMILILGLIFSTVSISINDISQIVKSSLPANTSSLIMPLLSGRGIDYNIWILIISALLLVSKGTKSIIRVADTIYGIREKNSIKITIKSILLSIQLILLLTFIIIFPILGTRILHVLDNFKIVSNMTDNFIYIFNILKWPITMFVIYINLKVMYKISPNKPIPKDSVITGAAFTSVLWVIITALYSFYITHLTKYNIFYGGASNIIILMLWIYLISYIFVLGMSINASYLKNQNDLQ
ncbi:MAG: YihY/virulence factor BrkB family protein [Bacilli bacterium]|nr:YihY/virulence factor BrkB family protein [Bacilli bacterium]